MTDAPKKNEWLNPNTVLAALGMFAAVAGAWMSFDARISRVEASAVNADGRFERVERTSDRIEAKLDRLLLREGNH